MLRTFLLIRAYFGWGGNPEALRLRGRLWIRSYLSSIVFLAVLLGALIGVYPLVDPHVLRLPPMTVLVRMYAQFGVLYLLFAGTVMALPGAVGFLIGRGQDATRTRTIYGRCFAVIISQPSYCFARIGLSREHSHWYVLPIDWDETVKSQDAELELVVNAGTGWVERLRRFGQAPVERIQPVPDLSEARVSRAPRPSGETLPFDIHEDQDEEDADLATEDEKRILKNFARRQPLEWRTTPRSIALNGWACLIGGILLGPGSVAFFCILALEYPRSFTDDGARRGMVLFCAFLLALGITFVVLGIPMLRSWSRICRCRFDVPESVTGEVEFWMPYKDMWSPLAARSSNGDVRETLISVRMPDGQSRIFRIPVKCMHRVRQRGQWVRIEYLPTTERVQQVTRTDDPADVRSQSPQDAQKHSRLEH